MRAIAIANRHPRLRFRPGEVARVFQVLERHHAAIAPRQPALAAGELSVAFLTDGALARLHAQFLADPAPTDVITFAGDPALGLAGEICVSADAAARQARGARAFARELTLYLVHGWLHLAGYDDLAPAKKRAMRRAEARALRQLAGAAAVPRFVLSSPRRRKGASR